MLLSLFSALVAAACSCAVADDWSIDGARAEGAVFAEVLPVEERAVPGPAAPLRRYTATVRRAVGLKPGGMIRIVTPRDEAACGVTLEPGEPRWLLLRQQPEAWGAFLCDQLPLAGVPAEEWDRRAGPAPR